MYVSQVRPLGTRPMRIHYHVYEINMSSDWVVGLCLNHVVQAMGIHLEL